MEKITFKSPEQISEEKKRERLLNEGGIFYEKIKDEETTRNQNHYHNYGPNRFCIHIFKN